MKNTMVTRRKALGGLGSLVAASQLDADHPPKLIGEPSGRIAPRVDLVSVLEFENMAERKLASDVYTTIAGSDRSFFDRITFRPRMMVPTTHLDLTVSLFGEKMFTPVIAGPIFPASSISCAKHRNKGEALVSAAPSPLYPRSATICPPSATIVAPVTKRPASDASSNSGPSRSRSSPKRPIGISRLSAWPCSLIR